MLMQLKNQEKYQKKIPPEKFQQTSDHVRLIQMKYTINYKTIMKYQVHINLLDNKTTQPSKLRTKRWVQINDDARGEYNSVD